MLNDQRPTSSGTADAVHWEDEPFRDIHALTPLPPPPGRRRDTWETSSHQSVSLSVASSDLAPSENFTTMSREFSALVLAGSAIGDSSRNNTSDIDVTNTSGGTNLGIIGEEDHIPEEETNPLAIVPDSNPRQEPILHGSAGRSRKL